MIVTVFATTTCPYCKLMMDYLTGKNIPFTEKLVDQDPDAQKVMMADSHGFMGVPFTVVEREDGSKETIVGFDKGKLQTVFKLAP